MIQGPSSQVRQAAAALQASLAALGSSITTLHVSPQYLPRIIGKQGKNIKDLTSRTGATIHVQKEPSQDKDGKLAMP